MEAAVLLDAEGNPLHWHAPKDRTVVSLPDSSDLWGAIWKRRDLAAALAHTHPGRGLTGPSGTDMTTFDAIERGLGKALIWLIATEDRLVRVRRVRLDGPRAHPELRWLTEEDTTFPRPLWIPRLRELSYGSKEQENG